MPIYRDSGLSGKDLIKRKVWLEWLNAIHLSYLDAIACNKRGTVSLGCVKRAKIYLDKELSFVSLALSTQEYMLDIVSYVELNKAGDRYVIKHC